MKSRTHGRITMRFNHFGVRQMLIWQAFVCFCWSHTCESQVIKPEALKSAKYAEQLKYIEVPGSLKGMYRDGKEYLFYGCEGDRVSLHRPDVNEATGLKEFSFQVKDHQITHVIVKRLSGQGSLCDGLRIFVIGAERISIRDIGGRELKSIETQASAATAFLLMTADPTDTNIYYYAQYDRSKGFWKVDLSSEDKPLRCKIPTFERHQNPNVYETKETFRMMWTETGEPDLRSQILSSRTEKFFSKALELRSCFFESFAIMPNTDLAAIFQDTESLAFISLSEKKLLRKIDATPIFGSNKDRGWIYADPANDQFILVSSTGIMFIPYPPYKVTPNRPLAVSGKFPDAIQAGQTITVPLKQFKAGDQFQIAGQPEGMQLKGNTIQYTPLPTAVGDYEVRLTCTRDEVQVVYPWSFTVLPRNVELQFALGPIGVTPDGAYAVCATDPIDQDDQVFYQRLTTIDLRTNRQVADVQAASPLSRLDVTSGFLFGVSGDAVHRYSLPKLTLDKKSEAILEDPVEKIRLLGNKRIELSFQNNPKQWFDQESLVPIPAFGDRSDFQSSQTSFGFIESGMLLDNDTARPKLLIRSDALAGHDHDFGDAGYAEDRWHPFYPAAKAAYHAGYPAYAIPALSIPDATPLIRIGKTQDMVCLQTIDPADGTLLGSYPIIAVKDVGETEFGPVRTGTGIAVVNHGNSLYSFHLPELNPNNKPFYIEPIQSQFLVDEGVVSLQYKAVDAIEFTLTSPAIESLSKPQKNDSGVFEVELSFTSKPLWRAGLADLDAIQKNSELTASQRLSSIFKHQKTLAKAWFGEDLRRFLLPIAFHVEAVNSQGETAVLEHRLLLKADPKRTLEILRYFESSAK